MKRTLALLCLLSIASAAPAAVLTLADENAVWPTAAVVNTGAPTGDSTEPNYSAERDVRASRPLFQTFQAPNGIDVSEIYVVAKSVPAVTNDFVVRIYDVADVFAAGTAADDDVTDVAALGAPLFESQPLTLVDSLGSAFTVLKFNVADLQLAPKAGPAGYGIMLFNDTAEVAFKWGGEQDNDLLPTGRSYSDSTTSWSEGGDFSLAIVPEPTSMVLLGLGGLLALRRRR